MSQEQKEHIVVAWLSGNKPRELIPDAILMSLIVIVLAFSVWLQSVNPGGNWFMRSGAVVVLLGAILEYRHHKFIFLANATSIKWSSGVGGPVIFEHTTSRRVVGYFAHICVVFGTFIAAYGDIVWFRFYE